MMELDLAGSEHRSRQAEEVLTVLRDPIGGDVSRWATFIEDIAAVLDVAAVETPMHMHGEGWVDRLLRAAAATPGPVLVVPRPTGVDAGSMGAARLARALITSDGAPDVVSSARFLSDHLRAAGVHTTVLVVLSNGALPSMWEGSGHHAAAWHDELRRRHGGPDELEVLSAPAGAGLAISARAADSGVLLLLWRRAAAPGRAAVVRAVLGQEMVEPCLLVPIGWVERLRDRDLASVAGTGVAVPG